MGLFFSLKTHREFFGSASHEHDELSPWPLAVALPTLVGVTVLVALVSEVFVESVQKAALTLGMSAAFVGFVVVALVGASAEMTAAFSGARKNRLDLSVGIALGSAAQIALFVAPVLMLASYLIAPRPMDLRFWPGSVVMVLIATISATLVAHSGKSAVVPRCTAIDGLFDFRRYVVPASTSRPIEIGETIRSYQIDNEFPEPSRRCKESSSMV